MRFRLRGLGGFLFFLVLYQYSGKLRYFKDYMYKTNFNDALLVLN
jgi:hypothetical protein